MLFSRVTEQFSKDNSIRMTEEPTDKCKEWILNVIDQLRKRKARPDLERICHFVERKYGLDRKETQTHIEKLVDLGVVIKVVYKRGTSYRNATKARKRGFGSNVLNSNYASRKIIEAVTYLLNEKNNPEKSPTSACGEKDENNSTEEEGVSYKDIEDWIEEQIDTGELDSLNYPLHVVLQREIDAGRIVRLETGNFVPKKRDAKSAPMFAEPRSISVTDHRPQLHKSVSVVQSKRGRPPKRKHPLGRSFSCNDVSVEQHHQVAPVPVMPPHLCDFCQQTADCNRMGTEEELLFCKDCNAKAHPSCMNYSPELATRARNTPWQCIDCKTCCICNDPGEADCMLFCDACDKGYHMSCHDPPVVDKPQGKWVCSECLMDGVDIEEIPENYNVVDSTVRSTDSESLASQRASFEKNTYTYKSSRSSTSPPPSKIIKLEEPKQQYPECASWSINEVVDFFQQRGFMEQATAFQDQEIDGQSLLLLKRVDVLQGLSLKLGPALKIYNHVMKLQSAGNTVS